MVRGGERVEMVWVGGRAAYITAADADVGNADEDVVGICDYRDFSVFESSVVGAVEDYGWVLHCHC